MIALQLSQHHQSNREESPTNLSILHIPSHSRNFSHLVIVVLHCGTSDGIVEVDGSPKLTALYLYTIVDRLSEANTIDSHA